MRFAPSASPCSPCTTLVKLYARSLDRRSFLFECACAHQICSTDPHEANGGGIGPHWSEETGRERLLEMAGRMVGGGQQGLVEKLLAAC